MKKARQTAILLMILSLALLVWGCGAATGGDGPQTDPVEEPAVEQPAVEQPADAVQTVVLATLKDSVAEDVSLLSAEYECKEVDSIDSLAKAFINGDYDFAILTPESAAALYNATSGSVLAVDTVCNEAGVPHSVCVVSAAAFSRDPETVVSFVSHHQDLVTASLGAQRFARGSAMQRLLSEVIANAYVKDPTLVGGSLPPDNFYFLG